MRAKIQDVRDFLKASYREELYRDLYDSLRWITDADLKYSGFGDIGSRFPIWPLLKPKKVFCYDAEVGNTALPETRIRDTFNATAIMMAKMRASNIKPEYLDIESNLISGGRTSYWQKRCTGNPNLSGWNEAINSAVFDSILTGYGVVQIGKRTNMRTGKTLLSVNRHRPLNVLFDPYADTIRQSERICFVHILSVPQAEAYTGISGLDAYEHSESFNFTISGTRKIVQVFEYFSWCEDESPSRVCIVGGFNSEAYKIYDNLFECLPFSADEFMYVDGFELPQGAVYLQQDLEIQADAYRKRLKNIADLHAIIALNPAAISQRDISRIKDAIQGRGKMPDYITMRTGIKDANLKAFQEYPGAAVPPGLMELYQLTINELRAISGVNEMDRGDAIQGANTLGEVDLINQRSGAITGYGSYKGALFIQDLFQKVGTIAKIIDNDPLWVSVEGSSLLINNPQDPSSSCEQLFAQDSTVLVAEDELFGSAHDRKTEKRIMELQNLLMLPGVNQIEITKEILRLQKLDVSQFSIQPGMGGPMMPPEAGGAPPPGPTQGSGPPQSAQAMAMQSALPMTA